MQDNKFCIYIIYKVFYLNIFWCSHGPIKVFLYRNNHKVSNIWVTKCQYMVQILSGSHS